MTKKIDLRYPLAILCCALLLASCAPSAQGDAASSGEMLQGTTEGIRFDTSGDIGGAAPIATGFDNPVVIRWTYDGRPATPNRTLLGLEPDEVNLLVSFLVPRSPVPAVGFTATRDVSERYDLIGVDAPEGWEVGLAGAVLAREVAAIEDNTVFFNDTIDFFFETNIPASTEPGFYTVDARVEHANGISALLPVRVEILASGQEVATTP